MILRDLESGHEMWNNADRNLNLQKGWTNGMEWS